jgi:pSer/pThr/pTyr-binding forkhead associated (FHA) protein
VLSFSDGRVVPIDSKIIIGRAPKSDDPYVKTYKVASPNHDVSRSHMSIEPKGDGWLVSDLASTNGTLVRRPSAATVIAAEGSPVQVGLGTLISLGDGVVLRVDPA